MEWKRFGGRYVSHHGAANFTHRMIETGEEFLEMMGTIVFLYVLLEYTQVQAAGQVGFQISDAEPVSAKQKEVVGEFSPVR